MMSVFAGPILCVEICVVEGNEQVLKSLKLADDSAFLCNKPANSHTLGNLKNTCCCGVEHGESYMCI
jgi:hypothetical protein